MKINPSKAPDPFENYGPDVGAYFRLIKVLVKAYLIMTLITLPLLFMNFNGNGYHFEFSMKENLFLSTNLGNLGHATATCLHQFISVDDAFHISCPKGKLSKIWNYGLMPKTKEHTFKLDFCDSN